MTGAWGHDRPETAGTAGPSPDRSSAEAGSDPPLWWEVGDALWLAAHRAPEGAPAPPTPEGRPVADSEEVPPSPRSSLHGAPDSSPPPEPNSESESATVPPASSPPPPPPTRVPSASPGAPFPTSVPAAGAADPVTRSVGDRQALTRAVEALRRRRDSGRKRLDEEATAERFAARALATPHPERALRTPVLPEFTPHHEPATDDLILLIDDSLSMQVQQPVVAALSELLAPVGVFRDVRTYCFDADKVHTDDIELRATTGRVLDPHRLCVGNGHEIVLVLTDGVGDGWHTGTVEAWLAYWGRAAVVAAGQVLDRARWPRTGMRSRRVVLGAPEPPGDTLTPNAAYRVRPHGLPGPDSSPPDDAVAVPLIPMEARDLGRWARFVVRRQGSGEFSTTALLAVPAPELPDEAAAAWEPSEPHSDGTGGTAVPSTADELVANFRASAEPSAFHLAVCLAAIPLTMPTIRAVQRRFAPASRPADLTEVLCSGLVRRRDDEADLDRDDLVPFEFHPGVRELLLATGGRRHEILSLVETVIDRYRHTIPWFDALERLLIGTDPDVALPEVDPATAPFTEAVHAALLTLGGPVREAAAQWPSSSQGRSSEGAPVPVTHHGPAGTDAAGSDRMTPKDSDMPAGDSTTTGSFEGTGAAEPPARPLDGADTPNGQGGEPGGAESRGSRMRPAVWGQVPPRNVNFVGREELLRKLGERLHQRSTTAVLPEATTHALQGMGGVGKTQLALEYAWRHRSEYELVWWVPAETPAQVQQALIELAAKLGISGAGDPASTVRSTLDALQTGSPYSNWLLIYDNAGDPAAIRPFIPSAGPGEVMITSRSTEWHTTDGGLLHIDTFSRSESRQLLLKRGPESLTAEDADLIAQKLGDLPLAVSQTAVWLYETLMPPAEWLDLFEEKAHELLSSALPSPEYPRSVAATMEMTLDRLRETNPGALRLLQVCAFLAPQPIPRRLFNGARNIDAPDELAEILADPAIKLSRTLRTIDRYALIKMDHRNETFQLHRLVQETLKLPLSEEERREFRHCAHQLLANLDPGDPFSTLDWPRYVELLPHVWATELWECRSEGARQLVIGEMHFLALWGGYSEGQKLGTRALADWQGRLGPEHLQSLRAEMRYVQLLRNLGSFQEALDRNWQLLDTLTHTRGTDDEETLESHINLAWDLRNIGRFQEAVEVSTDAFQRYERLFGRDDVLTLHAAHVHAVGLRLIGRFIEALEIDWYNFERRIDILGPEHSLTQGSKYGYALGLMESGRYWEAMGFMEEQHEMDNRLSSTHAPTRLVAMLGLSAVKRRTGRLSEAVVLSEESYQLFRERMGPDHHRTALAAVSHAVSLRAAGQHEAALELSTEARQRHRDVWGAHHPLYADASVNHAVILRLLGQVEQARSVDEEALAVHVDTLGSDHPSSIANAVNLASDLFNLGDATAALETDTDAHERAQRELGEEHPLTLAAYRNRILDRRTVEQVSLDTEHAEIVARYRVVFGTDHPATLAAGRDVRANCDLFMNVM